MRPLHPHREGCEVTRPLTPIEAMIDAACAVDLEGPPEPEVCDLCYLTAGQGCRCWILMRCTSCGDTRYTERTDEDGDAPEILLVCPPCDEPNERPKP